MGASRKYVKGLNEVNGEPWWDRTTDPLIKVDGVPITARQ
jgi:hypothetical protein